MADVARRPGRSPRAGTVGAERGQLILVTALALAILFVALALILNTAIYTENLATRSGDIGGGTDAVRYHDAARQGVGGVVDYVNTHNYTSFDALDANLTAGIGAFEDLSARQFVHGDRVVATSRNGTVNGTRIAQLDGDRNFTNVSGEPDWTVAEDVGSTRAVEINVTDEDPLTTAGSGFEFQLVLNTSGDEWRLNVTNNGPSDTRVGIKNATGAEFSCVAPSDTPFIDVTAGTIDGEPCAGLRFADGLVGAYDIGIENGDRINGTFTMVVDDRALADSPGPHLSEPGLGQPFAAPAIYSADIDVVYETSRLYYESTVRVAPGEAADG